MKQIERSYLLATLILVLIVSSTFVSPTHSQQRRDIEKEINSLLAQMTLEEKLGQLQMLDGDGSGSYRPEQLDMVRRGVLGATLNVRGAAITNELQRVAVTESRLKIPIIFGFDVIHGYRTIFPIPLGEASSWDPAAAEHSAAVAAAEARAVGLHWTFAPMVDIARDPRWGRIMEGSGEDPFLGSAMARARVLGFQGHDYSKPDKVVACAKHWVGYGAAEGGRDYNTTDISEWTLREIYFPPFRAAVDAGIGTFMSAFNDLNGVPTSANPFTLTKVLRDEWKFDGFVVSDYTAVLELINHGLAANEADAANAALNAGVDQEMVSRLFNQHGAELLKAGKVSQATIDEAVRRVLRIKFRLGLFDNPYADPEREKSLLLSAENVAAARQVAGRSMVLLKNDQNTLPISRNVRSIALIGPLADSQKDMIGAWSGDGHATDAVTVLQGIKSKVATNVKVNYAKGCEITGGNASGFAGAVQAAKDSEVVILAVGESADMSGEASSRANLDLPGLQLDLVKAVQATGKPTIVVVMNGRPLTINWIAENSPAILEAWFGGTQAGNAIADVLFGDVNPGGKLPVTFPRSVGQIPLYYNHMNTGRPPDPKVKWTSKYLDMDWKPLFPFGYGLSYTQFAISNLRLSGRTIRPDGEISVTVDVQNIGRLTGDEVVQLYMHDVAASRTRPVQELKGFERLTLKPGEKRQVTFTLTSKELGFYDREMRFVVEPGRFDVRVGNSSADANALQSSFEVVGN